MTTRGMLLLALIFALTACSDSPTGTDAGRLRCEEPGPPPPLFEEPDLLAIHGGSIPRQYLWPGPQSDHGFIAVGTSGLRSSSANGQDWSMRSAGTDEVSHDFTSVGTLELTVGSFGGAYTYLDTDPYTSIRTGDLASPGALLAAAHSPTHTIAVGEQGTVWFSPNDDDFTRIQIMGAQTLRDVVWSGEAFFAAEESGDLWTATDPSEWRMEVALTVSGLSSLAVLDGQFLVVTDDGSLYRRTGAFDVELVETPACIRNVTVLDGRFFAVGDFGTILQSEDGEHWTDASTGTAAHLMDMAYDDGTWVAVGRAGVTLYSSDLQTWTPVELHRPHDMFNVIWTGTEYMVSAFGRGAYQGRFYTRSGKSWSFHPEAHTALEAVRGDEAWIEFGLQGYVAASADGRNWTPSDTEFGDHFSCAAWTGDRFVAVQFAHPDQFFVSGTGAIWQAQGYTLDTAVSNPGWAELTVVPGHGLVGLMNGGTLVVFGSDWSGGASHLPTQQARALVPHGGDTYAFVEEGVLRSSDLVDWDLVLPLQLRWQDVISANGTLMAVGPSGVVASSTNGIAWNVETIAEDDLYDVAWGPAGPMVTGDRCLIMIRRDSGWERLDPWEALSFQ